MSSGNRQELPDNRGLRVAVQRLVGNNENVEVAARTQPARDGGPVEAGRAYGLAENIADDVDSGCDLGVRLWFVRKGGNHDREIWPLTSSPPAGPQPASPNPQTAPHRTHHPRKCPDTAHPSVSTCPAASD